MSKRYLSLICFHTLTFTRTQHTVLSIQRADMKVGGDEWLISVEWRGRRELNELSLFWGLCMHIHCYIFTMAGGEKKNLGYSMVLFLRVLYAKILISLQRQKHSEHQLHTLQYRHVNTPLYVFYLSLSTLPLPSHLHIITTSP